MKRKNKSEMKSGLVEVPERPVAKRPIPKFKARGQYRIVDSDASNIMPSSAETRTEDEILSPNRRARLLDIVRNLVRNSSLFSTILGQLTTNVVSTCGGKVIVSIDNEQTSKDLRKNFCQWTRNADFNTCDNFNTMLKRVLREYVIGGDVVLLFDDGLIEDSGKVVVFESNELVDVSPVEVEKHYGKGAWCSQGKVYSKTGRHIGTIVSKSEKNCSLTGEAADPNKCYFLKRDPNSSPLDGYWYQFSSNWREGRGVSPVASAVSVIHQMEDLVSSEILSSRLSSQIFCWLIRKEHDNPILEPSAFDTDVSYEDMSDEELKQRVDEAKKAELEQVFSLRRAKESSVAFEQLPDGFESQQVQTLHPNTNIQTMVEFLSARCAATLGLSKAFVTGSPTDADFKANALFSWPAITEFQKYLEQICDWVFFRWMSWAQKKGIVKAYVAEDVMDGIDWCWRKMEDLDEVAHQNAIKLALENNVLSYREILGNDWKARLEQIALEHRWMNANGITPVGEKLISGGQTEASKVTATIEEEQV